jgi:hypothetical protein
MRLEAGSWRGTPQSRREGTEETVPYSGLCDRNEIGAR